MPVINIVTSEYFPVPAAAAARALPWCEEISKLGIEVRIFTSCASKNRSNLNVITSFFSIPDNRASLPVRFLQEVLLGLDLGIRILWNRKSCDGCIITSPPFFMATICAYFSKLANIPYIFDVRDRYPRVLSDLGYLNAFGLLYSTLGWLEGRIYRRAQLVSTVTNGLVNELVSSYPKGNFQLVRNGFDELVFTDDLLNIEKRSVFSVIYHGRLGNFYNLDTYLEIMNLVYDSDKSIRFLMVGKLPLEIHLNTPPNLEILPAMKLESLSKIIGSCHLGICLLRDLPAMKNAFPAKAYDYIGAGIPVLAGPEGEFSQMVDKLNIGISFEKVSAKEVADVILEIKSNEGIWSNMCANLKKCRHDFGRRKIAREFFSELFKN
ncbi:MAG: hypothetical protein CMI20_00850 [Opitutae bacterium]|nr:hypothetical protein [Opitutae bacterium]